jgi:hypothetical protein
VVLFSYISYVKGLVHLYLKVPEGIFGYNVERNGLSFLPTDTGLIKSTRRVADLGKIVMS